MEKLTVREKKRRAQRLYNLGWRERERPDPTYGYWMCGTCGRDLSYMCNCGRCEFCYDVCRGDGVDWPLRNMF